MTLDKVTLGKNMEKYIDFFYGVGGNTPGTDQNEQIKKLLNRADLYFDTLISQQKVSGGARDNQRVGLANITEFLTKAGTESPAETTQ